MEDALERAGCPATMLRPGAIYGPHPTTREWTLVRRIALGDHHLPLPDGGVQLFHRVAVGSEQPVVEADRESGCLVPTNLTQSRHQTPLGTSGWWNTTGGGCSRSGVCAVSSRSASASSSAPSVLVIRQNSTMMPLGSLV